MTVLDDARPGGSASPRPCRLALNLLKRDESIKAGARGNRLKAG